MPLSRALVPILLPFVFAACGGEESSPCDRFAERVETCFAVEAPPRCDAATAQRLADADCAALAQSLSGVKSDGAIPEEVRDAIREAVKTAIEVALEQSLGALVKQLGGDLDQWTFYLLLDEVDSRVEAEASAARFTAALAGAEGMAPLVQEKKDCWLCDTTYRVLHGPCPIALTKIGSTVVDLVLEHPELLALLGGSGDPNAIDVTKASYETSFSVPLQVLPLGKDAPAELGCQL